jgi:hypothetical protein
MKRLLMWAVGVPFLVVGMVVLSFGGAGQWTMAPAVAQVDQAH